MMDEVTRRELWSALQQAIGEHHADTLMTMLPPQPVPDLATREDVAATTTALRSEIAAVRGELAGQIAAVRSELAGEIIAVRSELVGEFVAVRSEIAAVRSELGGRIDRLEGSVGKQIATQTRVLTAWIVALLFAIMALGFSGAFAAPAGDADAAYSVVDQTPTRA